jgi:superfamily II DNA/RNA helicase
MRPMVVNGLIEDIINNLHRMFITAQTEIQRLAMAYVTHVQDDCINHRKNIEVGT